MPGETTDNKVHYHLSAHVQFDKDHAFNGEKKNYGTWVNKNEEIEVEIENCNFYSGEQGEDDKGETIYYIKDELQIDCLIDNNNEKKIYPNSTGRYSYTKDLKKAKIVSIDNKGNIDKTKAGNTYNIFAKDPNKQFYHGGSISGYSQDLIQEKKSFTLFYTKENIPDLNNENSILIGLGEIQNKIGVLNASDRFAGGKIYCYDHYEKKEKTEKYHLFRFPYQELIYVANNNHENKDSAKQFLEELIEPLSIENSDKPFFSKETSKLISTYIVLKYANRLYEQIMKLKQNNSLWGAVKTASGTKWHFCDDNSIRFLKDSIEKKLREAQLTQKNPGLWALKDYFQINSGNEYENFLKMCSGESNLDNDLRLFNHNSTNDMYNSIKNFINLLINYPIYNKKTIQRIFTHLGFECIFKVSNQDSIYTNLIELEVNGKTINDLIGIVNGNKKIENNENKICKYNINPEYLKTEINDYLYKNGICKVNFVVEGSYLKEIVSQKLVVNIFQSSEKSILKLEDLKINPYLLFEKYIQNDDAPLLLDDIDWGQKIIQKDTFKVDNVYRFRAIVVEYIKKQENQSGHVWVSYEDAQEYLNDRLYELDSKNGEFYKIVDLIDKDEFNEVFEKDNQFLTLKEFASREEYINGVISELIKSSHSKSNKVLEELKKVEEEDPDNKFIESEKSLIKMKKLDFVFISGVAGSGKSHTLCKYLDYLAENKITDFQVLTPSGKAANVIKNKIKNDKENFNSIKRIEDLDKKISTADRYIVDSGKIWNHQLFAKVDDGKDEKKKTIKILIIDEISMITLDTLYYILKIKKPEKLIILGDIKQLPPIGYGSLATSIYNHLFLESSFQDICLAKMETSHRADDNSQFIKHSLTLRDKEKQLKEKDLKKNIIENSKEELDKKLLERKKNSFILIPYSNEGNNTIGTIIETIYNIEGTKSDFSENIKKMNKDIQILTPNRIGESGTYAINDIFKKKLDKTKEGLKFIYNKNDKINNISNGTMGYYEPANKENKETKPKEKKDKINFDGIKVDYSEYNENYELGFAITVHKSQGSGFPIVILVLPEKNNSLITKELIYTALTRPEKKMYILYHEKNIKALTHLPSIPHRNMNLFDRDKLLWIKDEIEYPIPYNKIEYRRKQDLYFALMLEYSDTKEVTYHKNGSFVLKINNEEILLMPKFYIEEKQDKKSFKYLKSIDLQEVYKNFEFKLGGVVYEEKRDKENKEDIISDNNDSIEITTHNGLRTRSWSEAILMLIFDKLEIPYFYEVEIRREDGENTYKLTYPNPKKTNYRIPDFTVSSEKIDTFPEKGKEGTVEIKEVKCIIEHLGMLTNDSYLSKWKEKVADYYDVNKYNFKVIAPISSLTKQDRKYFVSEIWDKDGSLKNINNKKELEEGICFTTDEEDLKDIPNLIEKLKLLKDFYFPN